ncbi:ribonuclease HII [Neolewinella lacunae]|uniref:Ribonuclease HII n=1 Tax=Neolewinella lacunae TaxID=1517758 RepID=A0A923PJD1_9BACT|nr:ribonuclease HII [Neolewinella lacunae]MBC6994394.1 ribonuclease HII [Neolewinella lacunae]MDN3633325.1 ribonuclease HII [Neolewinella lacunae]
MLLPFLEPHRVEAGCDEAGRGCLAGPVFAAAVILPPGYSNSELNDSKKLNAEERDALRQSIETEALAWSVASFSVAEIDRHNIFKSSYLAMHRALDALAVRPDFLLIDGKFFIPYPGVEHQCVIKGDGKFQSIAAAGILAKTHRDAYMRALNDRYPQYGWDGNAGYPTEKHRAAILAYGATEHHRKSFRLLKGGQQYSLFAE